MRFTALACRISDRTTIIIPFRRSSRLPLTIDQRIAVATFTAHANQLAAEARKAAERKS